LVDFNAQGHVLSHLGRYEEALLMFGAAIERSIYVAEYFEGEAFFRPWLLMPLLNSLLGRARAYVALGRLRDALADYDRVLFLKPNLTEIAKERDIIKVGEYDCSCMNST
jgi:tetratricopeptide (TPR) repeat protein